MEALTEADLLRVLEAGGFPDEELPRIFRNRGYRDAVVALAIQRDAWENLIEAARRSIAERGTKDHEVPYGEFTVLAMGSWRSNGELYPSAHDLRELMLNGSYEEIRMLNKMIMVQEQGVPFSIWERAMSQLDVEQCIAYAVKEQTEGRG